MPSKIDIDTDKLREQIAEAHERARSEGRAPWVRYVGLSAAFFAVFAAIAALRSGDLINGALIDQMKSTDAWNEYDTSRQKEHLYTVAADGLVDRGATNAPRLRAYRAEIAKEAAKERSLAKKARGFEDVSGMEVRRHHSYEYAVALLQVAIALGAVAALAQSVPAWLVSLTAGLAGFVFFLRGFVF